MKVEVTQRDIADGMRNVVNQSPLAIAFRRRIKVKYSVFITDLYAAIHDPFGKIMWQTVFADTKVASTMKCFNSGMDINPFVTVFDVPIDLVC